MSIWALSDLHLAFSQPSKDMSFFGAEWEGYAKKIEEAWNQTVLPEDLILIPGDISWARTLDEASKDLDWIDKLPGTKLILKGNHDSWWASSAKMKEALPSSIHFIHNNTFNWNGVSIGGSRLWDTSEYTFSSEIVFKENPRETKKETSRDEEQKLFLKELERLKISLAQLRSDACLKIAMTHYPPIGKDLEPSLASTILESFGVDVCVFGHLHSVRKGALSFGSKRGIRYVFASCDYVEFTPVKIV